MNYWGTEDNVTRTGSTTGASRRPLRRKRSSSRSSVSSGGSVKHYPFLRQYFKPGAEVGSRFQRVLFFVVMSVLIYVFVISDTGLVKITQLRLERARLDRNIAELDHNVDHLKVSITRLKNDDFYIEKMGRERFNYIHRDERVYKIIPIDDREF
jgi:cell division protein FtsB